MESNKPNVLRNVLMKRHCDLLNVIRSTDYFASRKLYSTLHGGFSPSTHHQIKPSQDSTPVPVHPKYFRTHSIHPAQHSTKPNGIVQSYAVLTDKGCFRNYNEDRVSIVLNMRQPAGKKVLYWPQVCFFGLFDGHGGNDCANFLKDHLHTLIINNQAFPDLPCEAIHNAIMEAEKMYLQLAEARKTELGSPETAGSCAVFCLVVDQKIYIANVGDSRAILSKKRGSIVQALTMDHKPNAPSELERIKRAGGKVYQSQRAPNLPYRVSPGNLSVSRTIGDIEAKLRKYKGNPRVVIAEPDISVIELDSEQDFIFLGSDGIFDIMTNKEITQSIWKIFSSNEIVDISSRCGMAVEAIISQCLDRRATDNITALLIGLPSLNRVIKAPLQGSISLSLLKPSEFAKCLTRNVDSRKFRRTINSQTISTPNKKPVTTKASNTIKL